MKRLVFALNVCLCLPHLALGQALQFEAQGGSALTIRAKAQEQQWIVVGGKVLVAAVAEGKLVVQEFAWPPGPGPDPGPSPDPQPGPDPKPDPEPTRHWQVAFFIESNHLDNLTAAQQAMLASLLVRKDLEARGHRLLGILDPDAAPTATDPALQAWFQSAKGKAPCLAIAPMEGGTIRVYPMPVDKDALWRLLENPPAKEAEGGGQKAEGGQSRCIGGRCFR